MTTKPTLVRSSKAIPKKAGVRKAPVKAKAGAKKAHEKAVILAKRAAAKAKTRAQSPPKSINSPDLNPAVLFKSNPIARIELARGGLPAAALGELATRLGMGQDKLSSLLGIPRSTVARKLQTDERLSAAYSERLLGVLMLIGQVTDIMGRFGDHEETLDIGLWMARWLEESIPALGGRTPVELMDTGDGRQLVSRLLAQSVSGAYV